MKRSMFLVLGLLFSLSFPASGEESTPYPVGSIDTSSEKFDLIYNTVADQHYEAEKAALKTYEITILQTISPGYYRVRVGETTYAMEIPLDRPLADDEVIQLPAVETDEVYQYTTVLGALSTIKVAKVPPLPKRMTKDEFLMFLKSGKRFEIQMGTTERRCTGCGGFGTTSGVDKTRCRLCYGRGIFHDPKMFTVFW